MDNKNDKLNKASTNDKISESNDNANKTDKSSKKLSSIAKKTMSMIGDSAKIVTDFAGDQLQNAKKVFDDVNENISKDKSRKNIEKYKPIFIDSIPTEYPKIIHVVDNDSRLKIKECQNAIGFHEDYNGTNVVCIYQPEYAKFNKIKFYQNKKPDASIYYEHPIYKNQYIDIYDYFRIINIQRVNELEEIARSLGAKYFRVVIVEANKKNTSTINKADAGVKVEKNKFGVGIEKDFGESESESIGIKAEMTFQGSEPKEPELKLWAHDESILTLIKQRLSSDQRIMSKKFSLAYNTGTGIKEKEAAKIDGVLKSLKFSAKASVQNKVEQEKNKRIEYEIEFE